MKLSAATVVLISFIFLALYSDKVVMGERGCPGDPGQCSSSCGRYGGYCVPGSGECMCNRPPETHGCPDESKCDAYCRQTRKRCGGFCIPGSDGECVCYKDECSG